MRLATGQFVRISCSIPKNLDFILETNGLQSDPTHPRELAKFFNEKSEHLLYLPFLILLHFECLMGAVCVCACVCVSMCDF